MPSSRRWGGFLERRALPRARARSAGADGWVAWARRIVSGAASLRPRKRTFPHRPLRHRPTVSSIGNRGRRGAGRGGRRGRSEPPERGVDRVPHVLRASVDGPGRRASSRTTRTSSPRPRRAAAAIARPRSRVVLAHAVHVGGVEQIDPELEGAVDRRRRTPPRRSPVELRHAHAAEPQAEVAVLASELATVHEGDQPARDADGRTRREELTSARKARMTMNHSKPSTPSGRRST